MSDFYVIGVIQHMTSDEWRHINATVHAQDWETAAITAGNQALASEGLGRLSSWDSFEKHDWNYWLVVVVELVKGLPVPYKERGVLDESAQFTSGPNLYVTGGEVDGDGWVQRLHASSLDDVKAAMLKVWDYEPGEYAPLSIFGAVVEYPDGAIDTWEPVKGFSKFKAGTTVSAALAAINRHRARIGQPPLDPARAGWSDQDVLDEATRIATIPNPRKRNAKLKRRLLQ